MKKTIIALLALAGVAGAATVQELNNSLKQAIWDNNYQAGDPITFTTTIQVPGGQATILTFAENWHLFTQVNQYIGVTTGGDPGGWTAPGAQNTGCFTEDLKVEESKSWLVDSGSGSLSTLTVTLTSYKMAFGDNVMYGSTLGVSNAASTFIISSIIDPQTGGYSFLDFNKVKFLTDTTAAVITFANGTTVDLTTYVPEPATATLSLLALAGLATRRRRK